MNETRKPRNSGYRRRYGTRVYRKDIRMYGRSISKYFSRKADADRWYLEMKRQKELQDTGLQPSIAPKRLGEFVETWLTLRRAKYPISTWRNDESRLKLRVLPAFGHRYLHQISVAEWEGFLDSLVSKHENAATTRNHIRALLHKFYEDAITKGHAVANVIDRTSRWKERSQTFDFFHEVEECQRYLKVAKLENQRIFAFAMLALNTGARLGEILALSWRDVDLKRRRIHIQKTVEHKTKAIANRTKSGKDRWVGISDDLLAFFESRKREGCRPDELLVSDESGGLLSESSLRKMHTRVCAKGELKALRIHDLRHTFASHYVMASGSVTDLKGILGHSNIKTTMRYAHLAPDHLLSKANVVSLSPTSERPKLTVVS